MKKSIFERKSMNTGPMQMQPIWTWRNGFTIFVPALLSACQTDIVSHHFMHKVNLICIIYLPYLYIDLFIEWNSDVKIEANKI